MSLSVRNLIGVSIATSVLLCGNATAELTIQPSITSKVVVQNNKQQTGNRRNIDSLSIKPFLNLDYSSARFQGAWSGSIEHLQRQSKDGSFTENFDEYDYRGNLRLIENLLTLSASGQLSFNNLTPAGYLIDDRYLDPDSLSKTRSNNIESTLQIDRFPWVEIEATLGFSDVDSEQQNSSPNNLNAETYFTSSTLSQGSAFDNLLFSINSSFESTKSRSQGIQSGGRASDFASRVIEGNLIYRLFGNMALSAQFNLEDNKYDQATANNSRFEYNSYGLGLAYFASANRSISLTANIADENDEENQSSNFVGVDFSWAFSGRTNVRGSYGRRFFGESGDFQLSYNSKALRAVLNYNEQITSFARLIVDNQSLGLFVCDSTSVEIGDCFQPSSLSPELEPGQQFVEFTDQIVDISEEPVLIKSTTAIVGYTRGRVTSTLEFRYSNPEYQATNREQVNYLTNLIFNWDIGPRTDFRTQISYAENAQRGDLTAFNFDDILIRTSTSVRHRIHQNLVTDIEFQYIDRDSNIASRIINDRRVSISMRYDF